MLALKEKGSYCRTLMCILWSLHSTGIL